MLVYKYRGGDKGSFERDLNSLNSNYFWAANSNTLNDPCETLISDEEVMQKLDKLSKKMKSNYPKVDINQIKIALQNLIVQKNKVGIYSLSRTFNHELLWAHYGNSHQGFCIEYDLKKLCTVYKNDDIFHFPIIYSEKPPRIELSDLFPINTNTLINKIVGYKSKKWSYEEEIRIIKDVQGVNYYEYDALKSIYFGLRMSNINREKIMEKLKGRNLKYYEILQEKNSYKFIAKEVKDKYSNSLAYLFVIPIQNRELINYTIQKKDYNRISGKATLDIVIEKRITHQELVKLSSDLNNKLFPAAKRTFMTFYIQDNNSVKLWGNAHFEDKLEKVQIMGLSIELKKKFTKIVKTETNDVLGTWIDEQPYSVTLLQLMKKNERLVLKETFSDGSFSEKYLLTDYIGKSQKFMIEKNTDEFFLLNDNHEMIRFSENKEYSKPNKFL
jgi:hypothetical protein